MAMNSMAYALSTVIRKSQTGVYTGFLIFLVGWICQVRSGQLCQLCARHSIDSGACKACLSLGQAAVTAVAAYSWRRCGKVWC